MEQRVLRVITNLKMGARKQTGTGGEERGYICDPGGYSRIARNAACCLKTAYNVVKRLQAKGVMRELEVVMRGGQRVKTTYFVPHYGEVLEGWRDDPTIFKTARGSVVVRGRARAIFRNREPFEKALNEMELEPAQRDAALCNVTFADDWKLDPERAPRKGCGLGRDPEVHYSRDLSSRPPRSLNPPGRVPAAEDEDLATVLEAMQSVSRAPAPHDNPQPHNMFEVVNRCFQIMMENNEESWRRYSDAVISPRVASISWDGFENAARMIEEGERAAEEILPQLRHWLQPASGQARNLPREQLVQA